MEGVGSRLGRVSARYGPTQTVFNGPVRKWKKKWVHISSSPSSSSSSSASALSQSNGHNNSTNGHNNSTNGSPLMLCKWTPLSSASADINGDATPEEPPPKRRFRYTPIAVLEERKKALEEKVEDEARESETNPLTDWSASKSNEMNSETALKKETPDSNTSDLDLDLCLKGGDNDSDSPSKDDQLMKSTIGDLF